MNTPIVSGYNFVPQSGQNFAPAFTIALQFVQVLVVFACGACAPQFGQNFWPGANNEPHEMQVRASAVAVVSFFVFGRLADFPGEKDKTSLIKRASFASSKPRVIA